MTNIDTIININGNSWKLVGDQTTSGATYDLRDIIKCGGRTPWIASSYSEDKPKPKKIKNEWFEHKSNRKRV